MQRIVCKSFGPVDDLVVEDGPPLEAGPGQVVIDVKAAGVNFVDGLFVQGKYQIKPPLPFTPGGEVAGVVAAVGEGVSGWTVGQPVLATTWLGGYAEQVAVGAESLLPIPDGLAFGRAASMVQSYATMLFALTRRLSVTAGETVMVLGAGGGIGLAAIDVARALECTVVAAASSAAKLDAATAMGAASVIDYETEDLKVRARELSAGGVDVVVDPVGGRHAEAALRALRFGGRYVVIGFASGPIPSLPLNQVLLNNRTVVGVDWGAWTMRDPASHRQLLAELMAMVGDGRLHPPAPTEYPLESAAVALSDLLERRLAGKAVLVP